VGIKTGSNLYHKRNSTTKERKKSRKYSGRTKGNGRVRKEKRMYKTIFCQRLGGGEAKVFLYVGLNVVDLNKGGSWETDDGGRKRNSSFACGLVRGRNSAREKTTAKREDCLNQICHKKEQRSTGSRAFFRDKKGKGGKKNWGQLFKKSITRTT